MLASLWLWRIRDDREIFDIVNFKMYDFSRNSRMFVHRRALYAFMFRDVKNEMSKAIYRRFSVYVCMGFNATLNDISLFYLLFDLP